MLTYSDMVRQSCEEPTVDSLLDAIPDVRVGMNQLVVALSASFLDSRARRGFWGLKWVMLLSPRAEHRRSRQTLPAKHGLKKETYNMP